LPRSPAGNEKASKRFFFCKKRTKKTFVLGVRVLKPARAPAQKFFAELFFKKATAYFVLI
jgi:hypothetical protein